MKKIVALLFLVLTIVPIEAKRKKVSTKTVVRTQLAPADARRLSYFYQEGVKQKLAGKLSDAYDLFEHCLAIDPGNPDALFELGYLKFYMGQDSVGTDLLRQVVEIDGNNPKYVQSLAAAYLAQNEYEKAIPVVEKLSRLQSRRSDVLYQLVELYKSNGQTVEAISALDRIEILEGRTLQTSLQKFSLYMDKGEKESAFGVLKDMEKESPYDLRIPIIIGKQYLENEEPENALKYFEKVREREPENAELRLAMMEYHEQTGQKEKREEIRDSLLYAQDTPDDLRAQMMALLIEDLKGQPDRNDRIMDTFDKLLRLSPSPMMYSMRTSYLLYNKADEDVVAQSLRDLLAVSPDNENALSRLLVYYLDRKDFEHVVEVCRKGVNAHPESMAFHFYLGLALSQLKQSEQALEALQNGLRQVGEQANPEYVSDIYEILGELYYEQHRPEDAFAAYDSCLAYKDDNASCLNNYAYYLSLQNERLDEAEKMAYRAIKLEPLNKTYLDTYAWVLFMQENYMMAKFYIDRVVSPSQNDSTLLADAELHPDVLEHAGDIYALNGKEEEALRYWSLAMRKGEGSALLEKKVKLKKYVKE